MGLLLFGHIPVDPFLLGDSGILLRLMSLTLRLRIGFLCLIVYLLYWLLSMLLQQIHEQVLVVPLAPIDSGEPSARDGIVIDTALVLGHLILA